MWWVSVGVSAGVEVCKNGGKDSMAGLVTVEEVVGCGAGEEQARNE